MDEPAKQGPYAELMTRRARIQAAAWELIQEHQERYGSAGSGGSYGGHTDGVRLAPDGSVDCLVELRHPDGRREQVVLQADRGGDVRRRDPVAPDASAPAGRESADETASRTAAIRAIARQHLPAPAAEELESWLLPALRLVPATGEDPVVARLGGLPRLPVNTWPVWETKGPLSHVLTLDLPAVTALLPELGLPTLGELAFFYYDGHYLDDVMTTVGSWDPETRYGARVLHLRPDLSTREHVTDLLTPPPPGLTTYPAVAMTAVRTLTWPSFELPWVEQSWRRHGVTDDAVDLLSDALGELPRDGYDEHLVGGHATPQQGAVEYEVEQVRRGVAGEPFAWGSEDVAASLPRWRSLLQLASGDAGMMWGDVGQLHWLVRDGEPPEQAAFTWQCG